VCVCGCGRMMLMLSDLVVVVRGAGGISSEGHHRAGV
jgi:hypothetical protein